MRPTGRHVALLALLAVIVCLGARPRAQANDPLAAARDLYAGAAYRDALATLDSLRARRPDADAAVEIEKLRAFCLVALGRESEADESVLRILTVKPDFRLREDDVSRRVFAMFEESRRRALPQVAQQVYERAKQAYDRQDFEQAKTGFAQVVAVTSEPGLASAVPLVRDLQTLARGFLGLVAANTPPIAATAIARPGLLAPATKYIYDGSDSAIVPPVVIEQRVPPWPPSLRPTVERAVVEVVIDEKGAVESVTLAPPFNSPYDELLLTAAKSWRYRPALCAREPVKFRRRVQIVAGPPPSGQRP